VQNVLRLRPGAGEAHLASAQHLYKASRDYDGARRELDLARRALPNEHYVFVLTGYVDRRQGRWSESTQALEIALRLDPRNLFILQQLCYNYLYQRRFQDMATVVDRVAKTNPNDITNRVQRGLIDLLWHANPQPLHLAIQSIVTEDPKAESTISNQWMYLALCERDKAAADRVAAIPDATDACRDDAVPFPVAWCEGVAARSAGNDQAARAAFARARTKVEEILRLEPNYPEGLCVLGMIYAALGKKEEAISEGRRAADLLPTSKDSLNGPKLAKYLAVIYAWTGEKKQALEQLVQLTKIPSDVSYGDLRLNPVWDPLRDDPSFESIVASISPEAKKP
jgi:serine/threonine-protein kinase